MIRTDWTESGGRSRESASEKPFVYLETCMLGENVVDTSLIATKTGVGVTAFHLLCLNKWTTQRHGLEALRASGRLNRIERQCGRRFGSGSLRGWKEISATCNVSVRDANHVEDDRAAVGGLCKGGDKDQDLRRTNRWRPHTCSMW